MKKLIILFFIFIYQTSFATVSTQLESHQVGMNSTFTITFTINDNASDTSPNFSPLTKDFDIYGTNKSTQISIINGATTTITSWSVTLSAKHTGVIAIPGIKFGKEVSQPLKLKVSNVAPKQIPSVTLPHEKIFLEVSADNLHPYVQSQVSYKVKLYYSQILTRALFMPPQSDQAIVSPIGPSKQYQQQKNGILYRVLEQDFAIFPQKSGKITIAPPQFKGNIAKTRFQDIDDFFQIQTPVIVKGTPIQLDVAAIPAAAQNSNNWLPTSQLTLEETWSGMEQTPQVGQPLTRHLLIKAVGLNANQLPNVTQANIAKANIYPDKMKTQEFLQDDKIIAAKRITFTYIPTVAGTIELPAINIPWWNTKTNHLETATLPARTLTIFPNTTALIPPPAVNSIPATIPSVKTINPASHSLLLWGIICTVVILWLITLYLWRRSTKRAAKVTVNSSPSAKQLLSDFKRACNTNNPTAAHHSLLTLARQLWPEQHINNVSDITHFLADPELEKELSQLNSTLYSATPQAWIGRNLLQAWQRAVQQPKTKVVRSALPDLNFE